MKHSSFCLKIMIGILLLLLTINIPSWSQELIRGAVNDGQNPVVGASVILKSNPTVGTVTNETGNFEIRASGKDTLVFKIIGFLTKEVPVNNRILISTSLQSTVANLNELVVVGYTTKELADISSSVSIVSSKQLNGGVTSNDVSSLLQGKVPGLLVSSADHSNPNGGQTVTIRGIGSIAANSSPLYVVDGIISPDDNVNPNDIQSITVLKDAAATGLYGSRASNGVIIITTKSGSNTGKTLINFNGRYGLGQVTFGHLQMMNSQQLYNYDKSFFPPTIMASSRPDSILNVNTDWRKLAYRTAPTQEYTLSASGGSKKTQFYISGDYFNQEGTLRTTWNQKYSVRTSVSHEINDKVKISVNISGFYRKFSNDASGHYGAFDGAIVNIPFDPAFTNSRPTKAIDDPNWIGREHDNFVYNWQYTFDHTQQEGLTGDVDLFYNITPHLTFSTFNRVGYDNSRRILYYDVRSKPGGGTNGLLENGFGANSTVVTSNRLEYINDFGKNHIDALVVGEGEKDFTNISSVTAFGLPPGLSVLDVATTLSSASGNNVETVFSKGLGQVNYDYDNRYFFVGSFINEGSSRFGSNNRSANFYTLAGSWKLDHEIFMRNLRSFNLLKLRISYGSTGNAQIPDYQSLGLYSYATQYAGFSAAIPLQLANPNLTWEKAKTIDLGVDIGLFNRIVMNLDLYNKLTNSLLLNAPLPYTSGFSSIFENVGSIRNKGIEINLETNNLIGKFKWTTNFNIAFDRNRVLKLSSGKPIIDNNNNQIISVGNDVLSWYMPKWAGVDPSDGNPLWYVVGPNGKASTTNSYNSATFQIVGKVSPNFTGGIYNEFSYKGFTLSGFFNFVSGGLVYNGEAEVDDGAYVQNNSRVLPRGWARWEKPGDHATEPLPVYGGNKLSNKPSSRYLEDGSYIRLRNIRLSYELPQSFLSRIKIVQGDLYISGDNLWTGTHYSGTDPEVSYSLGGGIIGGSGVVHFPIERSILLGINLGF